MRMVHFINLGQKWLNTEKNNNPLIQLWKCLLFHYSKALKLTVLKWLYNIQFYHEDCINFGISMTWYWQLSAAYHFIEKSNEK